MKVCYRGRIIRKRTHGNITFFDIDVGDKLRQGSISKQTLGERYLGTKKDLGVGDIIYAEGNLFDSTSGASTLNISKYSILTACSNPHKVGIRPGEEYRRKNRGLDLLNFPESRERFKKTFEITSQVRSFLYEENFLEVNTGILRDTTDSSKARDFLTKLNANGKTLYLRKSLEQRLKQLLVGGLENIFEMGKVFRNEGTCKTFLPEFTVLELYQSYGNARTLLDLTKKMLENIEGNVEGIQKLKGSFEEKEFYDFMNSCVGVDVKDMPLELLNLKVPERKRKVYPLKESSRGYILNDLFEGFMKDQKNKNLIILGYPKQLSIFAKTLEEDSSLAEEFRIFVGGKSFCYGCTELTDHQEQSKRIKEQAEFFGKSLENVDLKFKELMEVGLPPCAGLGLSLERLISLYLNKPNLRDITLFPI